MDKINVPITSTPKDDIDVTNVTHNIETSKIDIRMQWFFLKLTALWIIAAMVLPLVAFYLTRNPVCLSGFTTLAPPVYILYRITKYLFPKCDSDYQIEREKIKAQGVSHKQHNNHSHGSKSFFNPLKKRSGQADKN